jgi:hypothetical protein
VFIIQLRGDTVTGKGFYREISVTESTPSQDFPDTPHELADRALARLHKVAEGNGLNSSSLTVFEVTEQIVSFQGTLAVSPSFNTQSVSFPGFPKRKCVSASTASALQSMVEKFKSDFEQDPQWFQHVVKELQSHESQGWGMQSAKVTLPGKSAVFAFTQPCVACNGQKTLTCDQCKGRATIICPQCQGQGKELCYYCTGRGEDPQQPGRACHTCAGTRYAPCRSCLTRGLLPCPTCGGNRGIPCRTCGATGGITQEIAVECAATTYFTMAHDDLPSGLRRGLDRIGVENLGKGHGDISAFEVTQEERERVPKGGQIPVLRYVVALPYAEMKVNLAGKKALLSAVGKRCVLSGVPNFLDFTLRPWREKLHAAALGQASVDDALGARAVKDVLCLVVAGNGTERHVRRAYPFGMSSEAILAMIKDMRLALKKKTQNTRAAVALACFLIWGAVFFAHFVKGLAVGDLANVQAFGADLTLLAVALISSWVALNLAARVVLKQYLPDAPYALQQAVGKIGLGMFLGITAAFVVSLLLAPVKPLWLG